MPGLKKPFSVSIYRLQPTHSHFLNAKPRPSDWRCIARCMPIKLSIKMGRHGRSCHRAQVTRRFWRCSLSMQFSFEGMEGLWIMLRGIAVLSGSEVTWIESLGSSADEWIFWQVHLCLHCSRQRKPRKRGSNGAG